MTFGALFSRHRLGVYTPFSGMCAIRIVTPVSSAVKSQRRHCALRGDGKSNSKIKTQETK